MDVIHKVFVSSTYQDLREERAAVERTLLQLQCFPVGMEIFPASDDTAWDFIKSQIDDSDYYVLIIAARYGSIEPTTGKSYTEMEFDYAVEKNVPVFAFIHRDPGGIHDDRRDKDLAARIKLEEFRTKVQKRLCRHWASAKELQSEVATTLIHARNRYKREGFVRARNAVDHKKMAELIEESAKLREQVTRSKNADRRQLFEHGRDEVSLLFEVHREQSVIDQLKKHPDIIVTQLADKSEVSLSVTWESLFYAIGSPLMRGVSERRLKLEIETYFCQKMFSAGIPTFASKGQAETTNVKAADDTFSTVELQLRALGWISTTVEEVVDPLRARARRERWFFLTEEGVLEYAKLAALLKPT